jgi:hypothetical protein
MQRSLLLLLLTFFCLTEALMHQRRASSLLQVDKTKKLTRNHNNKAAQQRKATIAKEVPQYGKTIGPDVFQNPLMLRSNLTRTGGSCCCSQINGMADYISVAQCEGFGNMGRCCDSCFRFCNQVSLRIRDEATRQEGVATYGEDEGGGGEGRGGSVVCCGDLQSMNINDVVCNHML